LLYFLNKQAPAAQKRQELIWIFTLDGFFSAVQDKDDPGRIMVRSRIKEDLENMLARLAIQDVEILAWTGTDYAYRVFIPRPAWRDYLEAMSDGLNYTNFKAAAVDHLDQARSTAYHSVWLRLYEWQEQSA
jgi:hypothetical protein